MFVRSGFRQIYGPIFVCETFAHSDNGDTWKRSITIRRDGFTRAQVKHAIFAVLCYWPPYTQHGRSFAACPRVRRVGDRIIIRQFGGRDN